MLVIAFRCIATSEFYGARVKLMGNNYILDPSGIFSLCLTSEDTDDVSDDRSKMVSV